ncbi:hypothetical protein OKW50_006475 [Paraburkholderia youngii]|uniref:Uncharacterized protein n=1 Tax=Paraburkholderia youngii TaxID=2782701 RepID=A0A7W8LB23_9BURK|nr:hypothetical protein [Paraburkholderia youngii]
MYPAFYFAGDLVALLVQGRELQGQTWNDDY